MTQKKGEKKVNEIEKISEPKKGDEIEKISETSGVDESSEESTYKSKKEEVNQNGSFRFNQKFKS